jgi:hypothetical protein
MARKLTITLPDDVYDRLQDRFGPEHISSFIERLLTPYVITDEELEAEYREMAADTERELEALEWIGEAPSGARDSTGRGLLGRLRARARRRNPQAATSRHRKQ